MMSRQQAFVLFANACQPRLPHYLATTSNTKVLLSGSRNIPLLGTLCSAAQLAVFPCFVLHSVEMHR
jgi:hypothetical protein